MVRPGQRLERVRAVQVVQDGVRAVEALAREAVLVAQRAVGALERDVVRKAQEAVITAMLEAAMDKRRILEIYLNVAEWGPGVRGIGPAARFWLGKDARELTPTEAALLAAIIPSPSRYALMRERGAPSEGLRRRVEGVLLKMAEQGVLGDGELARALAEPVVFTGG